MKEMTGYLSKKQLQGLVFMAKYGLVTIKQFALSSGLQEKHVAEVLRKLKRQKVLGSAGNVPLDGHGKAPIVYYLTRGGWNLLEEEIEISSLLGEYQSAKPKRAWSNGMKHRLASLNNIQFIGHTPLLFFAFRKFV